MSTRKKCTTGRIAITSFVSYNVYPNTEKKFVYVYT